MIETLELRVNGKVRTVEADPERTLLSVLRDDLELTGAKYGCGEGQCGACTVLLDGRPTRACVLHVKGAVGKAIVTIEGLSPDGTLHPVQQAFLDAGAMQCGFCTPGMILAASALLTAKPDPSEADIVGSMQGNVCRCCVYPRIVEAIRRAAKGSK